MQWQSHPALKNIYQVPWDLDDAIIRAEDRRSQLETEAQRADGWNRSTRFLRGVAPFVHVCISADEPREGGRFPQMAFNAG